MRTSTITAVEKPNFITVRNYPDAVVNVYDLTKKEKSEFEVGRFRIKYLNKVPKEYEKTITFDIHNV